MPSYGRYDSDDALGGERVSKNEAASSPNLFLVFGAWPISAWPIRGYSFPDGTAHQCDLSSRVEEITNLDLAVGCRSLSFAFARDHDATISAFHRSRWAYSIGWGYPIRAADSFAATGCDQRGFGCVDRLLPCGCCIDIPHDGVSEALG